MMQVSRAMTSRYFKDMEEYADTDVVIVGAGSAGLACAYELSKISPSTKVCVRTPCVPPLPFVTADRTCYCHTMPPSKQHAQATEYTSELRTCCCHHVILGVTILGFNFAHRTPSVQVIVAEALLPS